MAFFTTPTSYWRANMAMSWANSNATTIGALTSHSAHSQTIYNVLANSDTLRHSSHPDIGHLILLVFEAVLEVVCVSLPGYIVARMGMFDAEMQKFVANLNVTLFTPCLIFTKLASQLTADKLGELAVIPLIFAVQTLVSYLGSLAMAKLFGFRKRPRNFVIAMGVFGNSNSLPISLVISLSQTLKGLHWDRIPGDNDDEVAARGILYLLIFQQLGQLLRWSWGYNVLLAPPNRVEDEDEHISSRVEQGRGNYHDDSDIDEGDDQHNESQTQHEDQGASNGEVVKGAGTNSQTESEFDSGGHTPVTHQRYSSSLASEASSTDHAKPSSAHRLLVAPLNGNAMSGNGYSNRITSFPSIASSSYPTDDEIPEGPRGWPIRAKIGIHQVVSIGSTHVQNFLARSFRTFPGPVQKGLARCYAAVRRFLQGVWSFMNPPLWAMLAAIIVASVPSLQRLFFTEGTFINNSVTRAVGQSGGVAIPLILVVLGANLARNTLPSQADHPLDEDKEERKLLIASLISRMLLPIIVMGPLLALAAKYVPVSILDDPIFVVVCFLLTGAPSALQLAQICQINGVYMGAMSKLLFQSYVVWILPSTLILVMCALEVLEWAVE